MTLVLGALERNAAYILSDTKLSSEVDRNPVSDVELPQAGLKTFFLTPQIAVAYSGTVNTAHQAITTAKAAATNRATPAELVEIFKSHCSQTAENEFLLALLADSPQILKVTPTVFSESDKDVRWIGNAGAANRVLREPFGSVTALAQQFQQALDDPNVDPISGRVVVARGNVHGIKFVPEMGLVSPAYRMLVEREWQTVDWGNAARGGFAYTTIVPSKAGCNGWGIHFFQGFCGYFLKVDLERNTFERLKWESTNFDSAIAALRNEIGIQLDWCGQLHGY